MARTIQGLLVYERVAEPFYGVSLSPDRHEESHIRTVEAIIDAVLSLDDRALTEPRTPDHRLVGICRHVMLLAVSILRDHDVPARSRGGFGNYFGTGKYARARACRRSRRPGSRRAITLTNLNLDWTIVPRRLTDAPAIRTVKTAAILGQPRRDSHAS